MLVVGIPQYVQGLTNTKVDLTTTAETKSVNRTITKTCLKRYVTTHTGENIRNRKRKRVRKQKKMMKSEY